MVAELKLDPRERSYRILGPHPDLQLFVSHLPAVVRPDDRVRPVLYVHGATFPTALSIALRLDGYSWRDALCVAGFDLGGFDFPGFGHSDRYPEMLEPPEAHPPLCRTEDASEQVEAVVRFILDQHGLPSLALIAHSWGSMPAARLAGRCPRLVERMVLFAPIARRPPRRHERPPAGTA